MGQWSVQHRAFVVETFFKNSSSVVKTQWIFRKHFTIARHGNVPCHSTVQHRTLRQSFIRSSRRSARRYSVALGTSDCSMWRILHKDLKFRRYKTVVVVQGLSDRDMANRSRIAERLIGILFYDFIILMTDEAHFHLSSCQQTEFPLLAEKIPQQLHQQPLHSARVTVWCGVAKLGVIGRHFFENEDGRAVTVTSASCVEMLRNFLSPELSSRPYGSSKMVQLPIQREHPWRSFRRCFRGTLFHCAASFHGLHVRLISRPVIISFGRTSKRKCTPLDHGPSKISRSQFGSKFKPYQKTWRREHWETWEQGWKCVYAMMSNILVIRCWKRNKQRRNEMYVE
jgi:hypothetical protein